MAKLKIRGKDLKKAGVPPGKLTALAIALLKKHYKRSSPEKAIDDLKAVLAQPEAFLKHEIFAPLADLLMLPDEKSSPEIGLRTEAVPCNVFGATYIEEGALHQIETAARLPVAVAAALMPDAHQGYGLPIGGVLAVKNAIIPYAVGVDIGCRMCLSIFPAGENLLKNKIARLEKILLENTLFGAGKEFSQSAAHPVLEHRGFSELPIPGKLHLRAARQLGSSGSGNHFAEFGLAEFGQEDGVPGLAPGKYFAFLTHSGSRGLGSNIAAHYTNIAMEKTPLPRIARHLAWLDLDSEEGQEYWQSMQLAGEYASACHHLIHDKVATALGMDVMARIENHHNFAWKEVIENEELIVHRKGATPASKGVLGIIPGSMVQAGYIVKGKGLAASLQSASHGAGRQLSRRAAMQHIQPRQLKEILEKNGVHLIGGGLDEAPQAYKNIDDIMRAQKNMVEILGKFQPFFVRMDS
ncbi:MAG: RtcB family protein [Cyclobacteriaceae bacterium]|nr:RtcB family protein [Cyclobacteriaceae bacterium]